MKQQATKLMSKFADVNLLKDNNYTFNVYLLNHKEVIFPTNMDISYPSPNEKDKLYYIAEVCLTINLRGGFICYKHAFQLDIASLKHELELIDSEKAKLLIIPDRIANILTKRYHEVAEYLRDYNDVKDLYKEIASLFNNNYGTSIAEDFGV
jgi:hypothetical protein